MIMENIIIPSADNLPVHWLWFQVLLVITFSLHLLFVNLILGGSILSIVDRLRGEKLNVFSKNLPVLVALTINLGVPPLLFVQVLYGQFFYTSSVLMAVFWIAVIPVLILAYYGTYIYVKKAERFEKWSFISLIVSVLFMLYVAFMYVNNSTLALNPKDWMSYFQNQNGTLLHLNDKSIWPRFLHFILASVAIAAIGKSVFYKYSKKITDEIKTIVIKKNLKIFAWITIFQILVGSWFWLSMPKEVWKAFMGSNLAATILMILGWILALGMLHFSFSGKLKGTLILGLAEVFIMVIIREFSRSAYLKEIFHPSQLINNHQVSSLIVFLVIFIVGIGTIYYLIRLISKSKNI